MRSISASVEAEALVAAGYSVDAIALHSKHSPSHKYDVQGVTVHTVSLGKMRGSLVRYLFEYVAFFLAAFWKLAVLMPKHAIRSLMLTRCLTSLFSLQPTPNSAAPRSCSTCTNSHRNSSCPSMRSIVTIGLFAFPSSWNALASRYADHVITINDPVQELFVSRGLESRKATVMMNAADDALFDSNPNIPILTQVSKKPS